MANQNFINECKVRTNGNRLGKIIINDTKNEITNENYLQKITIDDACYSNGNIIGTIYVRKLAVNFINVPNDIDVLDKEVSAQIGVKYADNSIEYIEMGKYLIERPSNEQTANMSQITAYSNLLNNLDKEYVCNINFTNYTTIKDFYIDVCKQLGLQYVTTTFLNNTIKVEGNPFTNKETLRYVLQKIAEVACSYVTVDLATDEINLSWLSQNVEPDYEFTTNDYAILDGGKIIYGPLNSVVIKDSQIEGENVTKQDEGSILQNGETQITIEDNEFLYTEELRWQAIEGIWNRLNGLTYTDFKLTTYYGKPFLPIGAKVRVNINDGRIFDSYNLIHTFAYDGTFQSVIEAPALTKQQTKIKNASASEKFKQIERITNKINGEIKDVINEVDGQNQKISQVTQTVEELNSKIGDIADITTSGEDTDAQVELDNINQSEPIRLVVRPVGENISYLYPSDNLYPSDDLYMSIRTIRFHNNTTNEDFDYELPDDLLYYDENNYDEFILDYDGQSCVINKRVGYNADGTTYVLDNQTTVEYEFPKIVLSEGDYTVSILSYDKGYIFARLMTKNIYTTQFYTKSEVDSEISQTANTITTDIDAKLKNYSTTTEMNNTITQSVTDSKNSIKNEISNIYATKEETIELSNTIEQKITEEVNEIDLEVSKKVSINEIIADLNLAVKNGQGIIAITGNQVTIDSDNYKLNADGSFVATKATLSNNDSEAKVAIENGTITTTATDGDIGVKIKGQYINVYSYNQNNNLVGKIGSFTTNEGVTQELGIVSDYGDGLVLGYKKTTGASDYHSAIRINYQGDNAIRLYDDIYIKNLYGSNGEIGIKTPFYIVSPNTSAIGAYGYPMIANDNCLHSVSWNGSSLTFRVDGVQAGSISDKRLKKEITDINDNLIKAVAECEMKQYKADNRGGLISCGIMAQDFQTNCEKYGLKATDYEIFKPIQYRLDDDTEYYAIDYEQYLVIKNKYLENKLKEQENKLSAIEKRLKKIEESDK